MPERLAPASAVVRVLTGLLGFRAFMTDESERDAGLVVERQDAIRVYRNTADRIVIMQMRPESGDDDLIDLTDDAAERVILALRAELDLE